MHPESARNLAGQRRAELIAAARRARAGGPATAGPGLLPRRSGRWPRVLARPRPGRIAAPPRERPLLPG